MSRENGIHIDFLFLFPATPDFLLLSIVKEVHLFSSFSETLFFFGLQICCSFASGKVFLPAVDIRSQLLSFNGMKFGTLLLMCCILLYLSVGIFGSVGCSEEIIHLWQQICHRDLKLENTLLDGSTAPRVKICDFGYSKVIHKPQSMDPH